MSPRFHRKLQQIRLIPRELRFHKERLQKGVSEGDIWNFDGYLAKVIIEGTKQLAENMHGCPHELTGSKDIFDNSGDVEEGCRRWKAILEEIAEGFEEYIQAQENVEEIPPPNFDHTMELLTRWWPHLWD